MSYNFADAIPREKQLVSVLSRFPLDSGNSDSVRELLSRGVDWTAIIEQATRWQTEPVVFGNLRNHFAETIPPEVLVEIASLEQAQRAYALSRTLQAVDLAKSMTSAGIPTIVLKGPAIAMAGYGDCSRRTFADIDLLVPKAHLSDAQDLLVGRGYNPKFGAKMFAHLVSGQHALEFVGRGPSVEIHWSLLSRHLLFELHPQDLWRDARVLQCAGSNILALSPPHLFLYLCAHGAKHEWMLFRWICDVAQLARRLTLTEAEQVVNIAARTNSKRILALALRLVRETFGEEDSPFPVTAFAADRDTDVLIAVATAQFTGSSDAPPSLIPSGLARVHPYVEPLMFWIRARERRRDQLVCAARFMFESAPRDSGGGALNRLIRPARLVANALMRAVHAS
jgi:hypothetical protein